MKLFRNLAYKINKNAKAIVNLDKRTLDLAHLAAELRDELSAYDKKVSELKRDFQLFRTRDTINARAELMGELYNSDFVNRVIEEINKRQLK